MRDIALIVVTALFIGFVVGMLSGIRYALWGDLRFWNVLR